MTEQEFLKLTGKEKVDFVNKFIQEGLGLEEIAKQQFDRSRSWLSKLLNKDGFHNPGGKGYVPFERVKEISSELPSGLLELLEYKDKLIVLATAQTKTQTGGIEKPDVSIIQKYDGEELVPRSFKLPKTLSTEFDNLGAKLRLNKQDLCKLAIAYFVQQYKNE